MRATRLACFWLLFILTPLAYAGDRYFVEPAQGSGAAPADLQACTDLVRAAVGDYGGDVVDDPARADYGLRPKLLRLGEAFVLTLEKIRGTRVVFSSQLKAAHMSELDRVAARVTRAVIKDQKAGVDARVGEVTDEEAHEGTQRRPARTQKLIAFGGCTLSNLNVNGVGYSFAGAYAWDVNRAQIKLLGDFSLSGSAFLISGGLGTNFFFTLTDIAPYASADFGYGFSKSDAGLVTGETRGGFMLGLGGGVQFLRTSVVSIDVGLRLGFLLASNSLGSPHVFSFRLGLWF